VLPVGWTLNFEMLFYLVFGLAIAFGMSALWFTLVLLALVYGAGQLFPEITVLRFYSQSLIFEFVLGIVVARICLKRPTAPPEAALALIAAGAVIMFLVDWGPNADRFSTFGCGAALMVLGAVWLEPWISGRKTAVALSFLGDASYSIYLSHTFIVPGAVLLLKVIGMTEPANVMLIVCALVIIAGCYSYLWIERPLTRLFRRVLLGPASPPVTAGLSR
jgi:peptidoglycan/LPS O-acetylase OafA/YrhL